MIVCLDPHVLVWGVRCYADEGQEEMVPRAQKLLEQLEKEKATIIVPAPVVAEYLLGVPPERQPEVHEALAKRFAIAPFDAAAAALFAEIWYRRNGGRSVSEEMRFGLDCTSKHVLKVDCQIVAIARSRKANVIYSHDEGVRKFAGNEIEVRAIPPLTKNQQLTFLYEHLIPSDPPEDVATEE